MTTLLGIAWSLRTIAAVLGAISFWQVKEYRTDRVRAHLTLPSSRQQALHPLALGKLLLLAVLLWQPTVRDTASTTALLLVIFGIEVGWACVHLARGTLRRPHPTLRALAVIVLALLILVGGVAAGRTTTSASWPVILLAAERLTLLAVLLGVAVTMPPAAVARRRTIRRATAYLRTRTSLQTIGITGSMGKSTTKEFLATMLETRFHVAKTPANVNTEIGVAQAVLSRIRPEHEYFICEMGAYRPGEIAAIAAMTRPRLGILTAVRDQHLGLFGSREEIARTKGELLRALPPDGIAVVNGDDPACVQAALGIRARRILRYGRGYGNEVRAIAERIERDRLSVDIRIGSDALTVAAPLLGTGAVGSLLAAVTAAHALGISHADIQWSASRVRPVPRTMEPRTGPSGTWVIDDTYSANPDGVVAALEYLPQAGARTTVVVLTTMIELGAAARAAHRRIGEVLARVRPRLTVVTSRNYAEDVLAGARTAGRAAPQMVVEPRVDHTRALVEPLLGPETALLLEGRIPERLRQAFLAS